MSYEIVKTIKINQKDSEVHIKSATSNVYPKDYRWWHSSSLSKILKEEGMIALQKELLLQYYEGNFQKSNNDYEKSLISLDRETIYFGCDVANKEDIKKILLKNYIDFTNRKKGKFVVFNTVREKYVSRFCSKGCYLTEDQEDAKVFPSKEDAALKLQYFDSSKYEIYEVA